MKKTIKEHPITFFRKANEAKQAVVKKSMKKAQDGIEMNDDMINKAGSTGGYKKPMRTEFDAYKEKLWNEQYNSDREKVRDTSRKLFNDAITNRQKTDSLNEYMRNNPITPKKKGGVVKKKK
jgi:hypothetical protein